MAKMTCANCATGGLLTFFAPTCTWCGGDPNLAKGAVSSDAVMDRLYDLDEDITDPAEVVRKWTRGADLTAREAGILADLSLQNRIEQFEKLQVPAC